MSKDALNIKSLAKKIRKEKKEKKKEKPKNISSQYLSSGSTLLNLACTNNPFGAFPKGKYIFFVGDSTSGKTFLAMTCFAEALQNEKFKDYRLIYDNVEDGCMIDLEKLFTRQVAERVQPPKTNDDGSPIYSYTVEEFYYNVDDAIKEGAPFIYILDSMDGLSSEAEGGKFEEHKQAYLKGKEAKGSYGDGKAKKNSEGLRKVMKGLRDSNSILIVICQTRDNIASFGFGDGKTRSGGHALRFYSTLEIWTSLMGKIKKSVKGKDRNIGIKAKVKVKKNRITGQLHESTIDIYPFYGIDDIGGCIDYLISEGRWKKSGQTIKADDFNLSYTKDKLINYIEENGLYRKLQSIVGECWNEIVDASKLPRRKKYE